MRCVCADLARVATTTIGQERTSTRVAETTIPSQLVRFNTDTCRLASKVTRTDLREQFLEIYAAMLGGFNLK